MESTVMKMESAMKVGHKRTLFFFVCFINNKYKFMLLIIVVKQLLYF